MARQDEITRSASAADGALRRVAQLAQTQIAALCNTLGIGDYDASKAAEVCIVPSRQMPCSPARRLSSDELLQVPLAFLGTGLCKVHTWASHKSCLYSTCYRGLSCEL